METYRVKTRGFEGPLALLLQLIEEKKLDVSSVSLAEVTEDFLSHFKSFGALSFAATAEFIVTAATLMLIKSKNLLPGLEMSEEESEDIAELERRLALYRVFRTESDALRRQFGKQMAFRRESREHPPVVFAPGRFSLETLRAATSALRERLPREEKLPETTVRKAFTIEEVIGKLHARIERGLTSFRSFVGDASKPEQKVFIIVSFLALLELAKQGIVALKQASHFSDIEIGAPEPYTHDA